MSRGEALAKRVVKLVAVGNSKGIRLPKALLQKYGWSDSLVMGEVEEGVLLYSREKNTLSWKDTYRAVAAEKEDWSDFDMTVADGVE
ncbi:MAG: AbrB/MazE/SpoVT family DNA-binding domain-containing protein [Gammaproteobacteria bacterium]|nr:AbrB/MazE/SpoVT family DNA-binding domain-containing protein [Gammaproteobacteria bacterium]